MEPTPITRLTSRRAGASPTPHALRLVEPEVEGLCEHDRILTCWYLDAGTSRSELDLPATLSADFWRYAA